MLLCDKQPYTVLPMDESHLAQVLTIENQSHQSPWTHQNFLSSIRSSHQCLVIINEQDVIAYIITSTAADEAELLNITVAPDYRRQGIAHKLLDAACRQFDSSIQSLFLEVRESNTTAITFYHQLGFNEVGERPNYYPAVNGRETAIIMAKTL